MALHTYSVAVDNCNHGNGSHDDTHLATETLCVPLRPQGTHKALHYGLVTSLASGGKLLVVAFPAIRPVILFMESLTTKVFTTQGAEEMLWMPGLV